MDTPAAARYDPARPAAGVVGGAADSIRKEHLVTKLILLACLLAAACLGCANGGIDAGASTPQLGKLRHVVLFAWKPDTPPETVAAIEDKFRALPAEIPEIAGFEWGTDVSVEGLADGFTHAFLVTFDNADARAAYLPHPAHKAFVEFMKPHMEKVLVIDYYAQN